MTLVATPQLTYGKRDARVSVIYDDSDLSIKQLAWDNRASDRTIHIVVREYDAPLVSMVVYPGMIGEIDFPSGYSVVEIVDGWETYYGLPDGLDVTMDIRQADQLWQ